MFLDDKPHERFLEILFENRNKHYGAFFLRRTYSRRVLTGVALTVGGVLFLLLLPYIMEALRPKPEFNMDRYIPVMMEDFPEPPGHLAYQPEIEEPEEETVPQITADSVPAEPRRPEKPVQNEPRPGLDTTGKKNNEPGGGNDNPNAGPYGAGVSAYAIVPGGAGGNLRQLNDDWTNYLRTHLHYPPDAKRKGIRGTVWVSFFVETDGSVVNATIKSGVSPELDKAALDMVNSMPKWKPSISNGWPAVQPFTLPVDFRYAK